ncbi:hypothetical protein BC937DRAFT_93591 [Endogone sp. FLAS-F59071]|nr:hypothetical protein BC937DRAFT_93591 [Endogone sp. FLAS-F59071]|eukprot:RUS21111.1 hypothetical protein BC937DRAFT_93591 [Endogone sp. FLAS-F59071]
MKFTSAITSMVLVLVAYLSQGSQASPINVKRTTPSCYNNSSKIIFTQYWIPKQGTIDMNNNGDILSLTGPLTNAINTTSGHVIATVDKNTYAKCQMEGTCLLLNGDLINLDQGKNTFLILDPKKFPYGEGGWDNPLYPFVSVASNDLPQGTTFEVEELVNFKLPNGMTHNGCVRVDDQGWSFGNCQFDFFILEYSFYPNLNLPDNVHAQVKSCQPLNYVTNEMIQWMNRGGHTTTANTISTATKTKSIANGSSPKAGQCGDSNAGQSMCLSPGSGTSFQQCTNGSWLDRNCGPGTVCLQSDANAISCGFGTGNAIKGGHKPKSDHHN